MPYRVGRVDRLEGLMSKHSADRIGCVGRLGGLEPNYPAARVGRVGRLVGMKCLWSPKYRQALQL